MWRRIICRGTSSRNLRVGSASKQPTTCPVFSRGTSAAGSKGTSTTSGTSIGWKAWNHSWTSWPGYVDTRKAPTYCSGAAMLVSSPKTSVLFSLQLGNVCCGHWTSHSGGNAEAITIQPPNCVAAILNWNSLYCIMQRLFDSQREDLRTSTLRSSPLSPADVPVLAVDGHCHVDTLANQLGLSIEETLRQCQEQAPKPRLRIVGVITNCVFPSSWLNPPQVPPTSSVEVHSTYGVHPRVANTELDWFTLNGLFQDRSCVAIGECGLDYAAADIEKQREVFRRQVQMAKLLGKPLVLHLRGGKYEGAVVKEESVYEEAFRMLVGELQLPRAHPLYIHCYVGGWKMCLKFQGKFKRVLFGLTVRSTEHEDFPKIAKGLGFERLALETDAPYLPATTRNTPGLSIIRHHSWPSTVTFQCLPSLREQPSTSDGSSGSRIPPLWESWGSQAANPDPVWAPGGVAMSPGKRALFSFVLCGYIYIYIYIVCPLTRKPFESCIMYVVSVCRGHLRGLTVNPEPVWI